MFKSLLFIILLSIAAFSQTDTTVYVDVGLLTGDHDGTTWANSYASMVDALAARVQDLTAGGGKRMTIMAKTTGGSADAAFTVSASWVASATCWLKIIGDNTSGIYSESNYRVEVADGGITINAANVHLENILGELTVSAWTNNKTLVTIRATSDDTVYVRNCHFKGLFGGNNSGCALISDGYIDNNVNVRIYNSIISNTRFTSINNYGIALSYAPAKIENCTFIRNGIGVSNNNAILINNLFDSCGVDLEGTSNTDSYCASTNAYSAGLSELGTGNRFSQTFTFDDRASDYQLDAADAGALGYGLVDAGGGLYSDDITGTTRGATWSIGAFNGPAVSNYDVTFDGNGSTSGSMSDQSLAVGVPTALTANSYAKLYYTFSGWSTTNDGEVEYADEAEYTIGSANVTLYAIWEIDPVIVSGIGQDTAAIGGHISVAIYRAGATVIDSAVTDGVSWTVDSTKADSTWLTVPTITIGWHHIKFCNPVSCDESPDSVYIKAATPDSSTVTIIPATHGLITPDPVALKREVGDVSTFTPVPDDHYNIGVWTNDFEDSLDEVISYRFGSVDKTIGHLFDLDTHVLDTTIVGTGTVTVIPGLTIGYGYSWVVSIVAGEDSTFSVSGDTTGSNATYAIPATEDKSITITFDTIPETPPSYTVTMTNDGNGTTSPATDTIVVAGTPSNINATPATNYHFLFWSIVSGAGTFSIDSSQFTPTEDATLLASYGIDTVYCDTAFFGGATLAFLSAADSIFEADEPCSIEVTFPAGYRGSWTGAAEIGSPTLEVKDTIIYDPIAINRSVTATAVEWLQVTVDSTIVSGLPDSVVFDNYGTLDSGTVVTVILGTPADSQWTVSGDTSGVMTELIFTVHEAWSLVFTLDAIPEPTPSSNGRRTIWRGFAPGFRRVWR